ncbi:hypothetical protein V5799_002606 [Amblyomma americanum]|uniref:Serpin domain-containing protein n=1 Tax=Amblyomma americanum TaxID=6943 RepID=A0AAQ4DBC3_AMBAM
MFSRIKSLQRGQVSEEDLTGGEDEDDFSTTPIRRRTEQRGENASSSDNYRLYMAGMSRFKYGVVGMYVSFAEDAAGVRERANEWLRYLSAFECGDVFPEGSVSDTSSIMLASLTYLRADWKWQFRLQDTVRGAFHSAPMISRNVVMMRQSGRFPMADFDEIDATALELRFTTLLALGYS